MTTFDKSFMTDREYLSRVLALAGHEFLTPLSVVNGYLRMLVQEQFGPLNEKQRSIAEQALHSCGRVIETVAEMRELRKLADGELILARQDIDFTALVTELANGMHGDDGRDVRIEVTPSETPLPVKGDRARLSSAVRGLMRAALRERGTPGVIVADCSVAEDDGRRWGVLAIGEASLIESLRQPRDGVSFEYEWNGGMGLVLPIARQIIEAHGGALWTIKNDRSAAASAIRLPLRT